VNNIELTVFPATHSEEKTEHVGLFVLVQFCRQHSFTHNMHNMHNISLHNGRRGPGKVTFKILVSTHLDELVVVMVVR